MSNKIYEGGYYNEVQKNRYLASLPETSAKQAERVLSRAKTLEEKYQTDLANFNLDQIESLLYYLNPSTLNSSRANFYLIQNYIRWGIAQGFRETNLNPLDVLAENTFYKKFIDASKKMLYTKDEIDKMVDGCLNAQDAFPVAGLFEGLYGTGYDELLNLKREHLLPNNLLELHNHGTARIIRVSDRCMDMIKKALEEKTYVKKNGAAKVTMKSPASADLEQSDYVLRNVITRSQTDGKADRFLIQRRIAAVKSYHEDWVKVLTPYIIRNSGMLYMAKTLFDRNKELNKQHYEEICEQFGISKVMNNGYEVYNYHRLKEDFLNTETIERIYSE
ncbi:phage lytic cycle repressor MrpR family protein [Paenibacillus chitinolyticus]|uniref:phage lytic cycle repressor MrpR family protein n=1 Tax=Paenibacillus chitinolyticus TaxID=79263 RepID=UPI00366EE068